MTDPLNLTVVIEDQFINVESPATPAVSVTTFSQPVTVVTVGGPAGPQGPPGTNTPVYNETPAGAQNGTNLVFTTVHPYQTGSTVVHRNGLREIRGVGYTESATATISFTTAPLASDILTIDYLIT